MTRLYAATGDAIARVDEAGEAWTVELSLSGSGAQCLAVDPAEPDTVYAGLREGGVRRSLDGGRTWQDCGLPEPGVFSLALSAADGAVYAGTEPSRLFRSDDKGESWRELEALLDLPSRPNWSFLPRPWTSHVRWIAPNPHDPDVLLEATRRRPAGAAPGDALRTPRHRRSPLGRPRRWSALGEPRPQRHLDSASTRRRPHHCGTRARASG